MRATNICSLFSCRPIKAEPTAQDVPLRRSGDFRSFRNCDASKDHGSLALGTGRTSTDVPKPRLKAALETLQAITSLARQRLTPASRPHGQ